MVFKNVPHIFVLLVAMLASSCAQNNVAKRKSLNINNRRIPEQNNVAASKGSPNFPRYVPGKVNTGQFYYTTGRKESHAVQNSVQNPELNQNDQGYSQSMPYNQSLNRSQNNSLVGNREQGGAYFNERASFESPTFAQGTQVESFTSEADSFAANNRNINENVEKPKSSAFYTPFMHKINKIGSNAPSSSDIENGVSYREFGQGDEDALLAKLKVKEPVKYTVQYPGGKQYTYNEKEERGRFIDYEDLNVNESKNLQKSKSIIIDKQNIQSKNPRNKILYTGQTSNSDRVDADISDVDISSKTPHRSPRRPAATSPSRPKLYASMSKSHANNSNDYGYNVDDGGRRDESSSLNLPEDNIAPPNRRKYSGNRGSSLWEEGSSYGSVNSASAASAHSLGSPVYNNSSGQIYIQVGMFRQKQNAKQLTITLSKDLAGVQVKTINNNGLHQVIIGPFANHSEAKSTKNSLSRYGITDAFIING